MKWMEMCSKLSIILRTNLKFTIFLNSGSPKFIALDNARSARLGKVKNITLYGLKHKLNFDSQQIYLTYYFTLRSDNFPHSSQKHKI